MKCPRRITAQVQMKKIWTFHITNKRQTDPPTGGS